MKTSIRRIAMASALLLTAGAASAGGMMGNQKQGQSMMGGGQMMGSGQMMGGGQMMGQSGNWEQMQQTMQQMRQARTDDQRLALMQKHAEQMQNMMQMMQGDGQGGGMMGNCMMQMQGMQQMMGQMMGHISAQQQQLEQMQPQQRYGGPRAR